MRNLYCVVKLTYRVGLKYYFALDPLMTFPNPWKDKGSIRRCRERALGLEELLKTDSHVAESFRKRCGIPQEAPVTCEPVVLRGIIEEDCG